MKALEGVGDAGLGEWEERGQDAYHVRRRLTVEEQAPIGGACDIRGSREAQDQLQNAWKWIRLYPPAIREFARREIESAIPLTPEPTKEETR